jgi:hypothetical protein
MLQSNQEDKMKTVLKLTFVAFVAAAVVLFVIGAFAPQVLMAQGPVGRGPMGGMWGGPRGVMTGTMPYGMMGGRGMWGGPDHSLVAVAAKTLGMSKSDLLAELDKDQSIADVAKAKNVDLIKIIDAFVASHIAQMSGRMTQEQLDAMVGTMKAQLAIHLNEKFTAGVGAMPMHGRGMWGR